MNPKTRFVLSLAILATLTTATPLQAQSVRKKAKSAERRWAAMHPFIAPGVLKRTNEALAMIRPLKGQAGLDTSLSEGSYDAFRHGFWMAYLAQRFDSKKILKLGEAHEKSNYHSFLNNERENGIIPDKANSEMDLWNNRKGAEIGKMHKNLSADSLRLLVLSALKHGEFKVIRKDDAGRYLDCQGTVIPPEKLKGTWENPKCLSPSYLK